MMMMCLVIGRTDPHTAIDGLPYVTPSVPQTGAYSTVTAQPTSSSFLVFASDFSTFLLGMKRT